MTKAEENKYPHSATLFQFCKKVLELKYQGHAKRVIDQDVGAILGYDPADCSHWKKGKKHLKSLTALQTLAKNLDATDDLIIAIALGQLDLEEALYEYNGYSAFQDHLTNEKQNITLLAERIIAKGGFTEAPIYLPQILKLFPELHLDEEAKQTKPFERFQLAKKIFHFLGKNESHPFISDIWGDLYTHNPVFYEDESLAQLFAGCLLVPKYLLFVECAKLSNSVQLIDELASLFWVSKSLINQRFKECFC